MAHEEFVVLALGPAALLAADFAAKGDRWWAHIEFLTDEPQGRETGSEGYGGAVTCVAGKMETFGLKPAGTPGYLQPVKYETRQLMEEESSIAIVREGAEEALERLDATRSSRVDLAPGTEAAMVFVDTVAHAGSGGAWTRQSRTWVMRWSVGRF